VHPDVASVLWAVTDRLYASWHVRAIVLLIAIAIAIATGGSFVIGSQTLNVRKSLDDAQLKAQTEIRTISAATQTRVADESKAVITRLHERGTDIDTQLKRAEAGIADLKTGSDAIKKEIIEKLSEDLKAQETSLKDEIAKPLIKARDEDLQNINGSLDAVRKSVADVGTSVGEQKAKLDELTPKLAQLGIFAGQSEAIGTAFSRITTDGEAAHTSRLSAESEAQTAALQRKAAESSAAEAEKLRSQTSDAVKTASDEALKHIGALGGIAEQLKVLDAKFKELDGKLTGEVAAEQARLKAVKDRITALDREAQNRPPGVGPEPGKLKKVDDLTRDEKKQVQQRLAEEGVDVGPIDGKFGKQTAAAVRAYQTKMKKDVTGELAPDQIGELLKPK
jgi:peptidoglycan hydrolase-like protein with peptidoglycan-binding domain